MSFCQRFPDMNVFTLKCLKKNKKNTLSRQKKEWKDRKICVYIYRIDWGDISDNSADYNNSMYFKCYQQLQTPQWKVKKSVGLFLKTKLWIREEGNSWELMSDASGGALSGGVLLHNRLFKDSAEGECPPPSAKPGCWASDTDRFKDAHSRWPEFPEQSPKVCVKQRSVCVPGFVTLQEKIAFCQTMSL